MQEQSRTIVLEKLDPVRLLSAFHVLQFPAGFYGRGATKTRACDIIEELTGKRPKRGWKPPRRTNRDQDALEFYLQAHFGPGAEVTRGEA